MRSAGRALAAIVLSASVAAAQQYVISTYAGAAPPPTPARGLSVPIGEIQGVATDPEGSVYFASSELHCVFKLDPKGVLTRVAGNSRAGFSGDGGPATSAALGFPGAVAVDGAGNLFIAGNQRIRKVSPSGIITTVAGGGTNFPDDGTPATDAQLNAPFGVAADQAGNLFITDVGELRNRILKVSPGGIISTVAGGGTNIPGDGGPATSALLKAPLGVAVDSAGNLFIAEAPSPIAFIRKVSPSGIITTVAGGGTNIPGDGGPATSAALYYPMALAVDRADNLIIADGTRIRRISPSGIITTVAGNGTPGFSGDGGAAASAGLGSARGVAADAAGNVFIADTNNERIRKVSADGIITTVAGNGDALGRFSGDGGPATSAQLSQPSEVAVDAAGNVFIADRGNQRIRKVSASGIINTVAGNGAYCTGPVDNCTPLGDGGPAISARLSYPFGVAVDGAGNVFATEFTHVRRISPDGIITTVAGNGTWGFSGDGGPAVSAALTGAVRVATDGAGNLFIADALRIRKVSADGIITTVAGNGTWGFSGDGGPATGAALDPWDSSGEDGPGGGLAVDGLGDLFFADTYNNRIRKVSQSGMITTVAGGGTALLGDGEPATNAKLNEPFDVAVDGAGNLFIADAGNGRIRKVSASGIVTTVAGGGKDFRGDGGLATTAALSFPTGLAVDGAGNIYVAEPNAIRVLRPINQSVWIASVLDAASERADPVAPGKIVVIYGFGLGPAQLTRNQTSNGQFSKELNGMSVSFNGIAAPILYTSATQVAAIVPYAISGTTAQVAVAYQGQVSAAFTVPIAASAPGLFTLNQTGSGQAAAVNGVDGTVNNSANPVKVGGYISLYATGEGQTSPDGIDGKLGASTAPHPLLPVSVTVGGIPATVQYAGGAPGQVAGLMQVNVRIPGGVQPGGYVPVVLRVGVESTTADAVWIAVSAN